MEPVEEHISSFLRNTIALLSMNLKSSYNTFFFFWLLSDKFFKVRG